MRLGAVLAVGLAAVAVGLALVLLDSEPRQAGTNYVPEVGEALALEGRNDTHCQAGQVIPGDTAALRLLLGTSERPSPDLRVTVRAGDETIATGRLPRGQPDGRLVIPIDAVEDVRPDAEVCIEARSPEKLSRTVLYGTSGQVRLEWLREGDESWLELFGTVAHRFGLGKPFVSGGWVLLLTALLLAFAWVLALRLVLRELSR
jgi:hypothetical protein